MSSKTTAYAPIHWPSASPQATQYAQLHGNSPQQLEPSARVYFRAGSDEKGIYIEVFDQFRKSLCTERSCFDSQDHTVKELSTAVRDLYGFFKTVLNVEGIKAVNGAIPPIVINSRNSNASWSCYETVTGQCELSFSPEFGVRKVAAHEYGHAIVGKLLGNTDEARALNEHFGDITSHAFTDWDAQGKAKENWVLLANYGNAKRDATQPITISQLKTEAEQHHFNSKIPTRAFYVAVKTLDDVAYGDVFQIWFATLFTKVAPDETIRTFAQKTIVIAKEMTESKISGLVAAIVYGWSEVEVFKIQIPAPIASEAGQKAQAATAQAVVPYGATAAANPPAAHGSAAAPAVGSQPPKTYKFPSHVWVSTVGPAGK
jgi:hypothetical protein